tara:strand:+ start:1703 stop:2170 length:468 start_codon:yes stop_codon:yes gene_type:complete
MNIQFEPLDLDNDTPPWIADILNDYYKDWQDTISGVVEDGGLNALMTQSPITPKKNPITPKNSPNSVLNPSPGLKARSGPISSKKKLQFGQNSGGLWANLDTEISDLYDGIRENVNVQNQDEFNRFKHENYNPLDDKDYNRDSIWGRFMAWLDNQ